MRSENLSFIVGRSSRGGDPQVEQNITVSSAGVKTPHVENKTYTKIESNAKLERNLMNKMQLDTFNKAVQAETKKKPSSSELFSLSAIDAALRKFERNSVLSYLTKNLFYRQSGREFRYICG